ncbi:MAG: DUF2157 domain-containing protein [Nocardioidaceae bacterium]
MTQDLDPGARRVDAGRLAWLESELASWHDAGLVDDTQAQAIRGRYVAARRFSLARLLLLLGGGFVGVGLLWLVASNLDELSPLLRFLVVTALWLSFVATAELLTKRRTQLVVGGFRLLASLAFGAVVFQAAQSLQVPAYEPALVGVWGLGALLYAYAVAGVAPLLVGVTTTTVWFVWTVFDTAEDGMGFVLPMLLAAVVAGAVSVVHAARVRPAFAGPWRDTSALMVLLGLFVAAFPDVDAEGFVWSAPLSLGVLAALMAVAAAAVLAPRARGEALAPLAGVAAGVLLVLWEPPAPVMGAVSGEGYAHAFVSVAVYVVAAGWYAVLGVLRDSSGLTYLATAALVLFTTVQSFAVFAPIITGATLFLVLGVIFLGSGFLFDRGRRHLTANLGGAPA